jgi:hypothetical protein
VKFIQHRSTSSGELIMGKGNRTVLMFLGTLLLLSMACSFGIELPWDVGAEDVAISPEEVSEAATRAAEAAATAAVLADQAGEMAATVVLQGDDVLGTAVAQGAELVATVQTLPTLPIVDVVTGGSTLQQKLANIQPNANGNFAVAITESDLNEFISGSHNGGFQTDTLSADNVQVKITAEHVELSGDVQEPIALPLIVQLRPTVVNGQLQFELLSASAGILPVPESMLDLIEAGANSELTRALVGLPNGVTVQNVTLSDGLFTIFGQQN